MLDVAYIDTTLTLVVNKHGKTATVLGTFFATSQHQVNIRITVSDETLHTIEQPATFFFRISSLQHHTLQVGTGIRLGQVHTHGLAGANAGNVLGTLLLGTEFIQCIDARLQGPNILETGIGSRNHLRQHGEGGIGNIQATITTGHADTPKAGLASGVEVLISLGSIDHASILKMRTFQIHAFGIGLNDVSGNVTRYFEDAMIVFNGIIVIHGSIFKLVFIFKVALFELNDSLH